VRGKVIPVPRGGIVASERFLSLRWKWSRNKVRQFLLVLRDLGEIKDKTNQQERVLILCKYGVYADCSTEKEPPKSHQRATDDTSDEPQKVPNEKKVNTGNTVNTEKECTLDPWQSIMPRKPKSKTNAEWKRSRVLENSAQMIRIGAFFGRQPDTLWTVSDALQLKEIQPPEPDIELLEWWFKNKQDEDYARKKLSTLMNNWDDEIDKARSKQSTSASRATKGDSNRPGQFNEAGNDTSKLSVEELLQ